MSALPTTEPDAASDAKLGRRFRAAVVYYLPSVVVMLALLVLWQLGVQWLGVKEYILPTPLSALRTLADPNYRWTANFLATLYSVLGAFALSAVLGVLLAIVVVWNDLLMRTVMPVLILFNTLPKIALAPLFVILFGIGLESKIVLVASTVFFLLLYNTLDGVRDIDRDLVQALEVMGATRSEITRKVLVPATMPWIFTGLRIAVRYAFTAAILGELMASNEGIGYLIEASAGDYNTAGVYAAVFVLVAFSVLFTELLTRTEASSLRWRASSRRSPPRSAPAHRG